MKPNLFDWAASELSQDAFICWLMAWSDPVHKKYAYELNNCANNFIKEITDNKIGSISSIKIKKQFKNIDVLVHINNTDIIVIEDKVYSSENNNQLERYKSLFDEEKLTKSIHFVYIKTGDQNDFPNARDKGYRTITRNKFLEILENGIKNGVSNDILIDFTQHLRSIENSVNLYKTLPYTNWKNLNNWNPWKGLYSTFQKELKTGAWFYIPQRNGGFLAFCWSNKTAFIEGIQFNYYLQLEHEKLCFKIHYEGSKENKYKVREVFRKKLHELAELQNITIKRNGRIGKYMTVAANRDYIFTDKNGIVDIKKTTTFIEKMTNLNESLRFY